MKHKNYIYLFPIADIILWHVKIRDWKVREHIANCHAIVYAEWITAQVKPPTEHLYTSTGGSPEEFSGKVINHNPGIPDQQESQRESD